MHYFALVPLLLAASDLVATVPARIGRLFARDGALVTLPPPIALPEIAIGMAWHPGFAGEPALAWLRQMVAAVFTASKAAGSRRAVSAGEGQREKATRRPRRGAHQFA